MCLSLIEWYVCLFFDLLEYEMNPTSSMSCMAARFWMKHFIQAILCNGLTLD